MVCWYTITDLVVKIDKCDEQLLKRISEMEINVNKRFVGYSFDKVSFVREGSCLKVVTKERIGQKTRSILSPVGYKNIDDFMAKVSDKEILDWGYKSRKEFEEVVINTQNHLEKGGGFYSKYAGQNGVLSNSGKYKINFDPLGYPIFKEYIVKNGDVNISNMSKVIESGGLKNIKHGDQCKAATEMYLEILKKEATDKGISVEKHMGELGFDDAAQKDILARKQSIDGYTWHHNQETGRMQLVLEDVHADDYYKHTGGFKLWGKE